ncbi:MAG: gliding motility-associated C-terminal domain-containing protein [Bacteroidales bacterium]|nr:gliding motility-associated C-terminal domain-containing protein [Bacteroidales bacterium]
MKKLLITGLFLFVLGGLQAQIEADFEAEDVCLGDTTTLISTSTSNSPIVLWKWDLDSDGEFDDASGDTLIMVYEEWGNKTVGLRIVNENSFSSATYQQVYVAENPFPIFNLKQACSGTETLFENRIELEEGEIESFYYEFGDDSNPSTVESPAHVYDQPGTYQVYMQITTSFGCQNENYRTIEIRESPELELNAPPDTSLGITGRLTLQVNTPFDSVRWSTGDNVSSITVTEAGTYTVTVYENGCPNSQEINVSGGTGGGPSPISGEYDIMNLITPNNDGFNDQWRINNITQRGPCKVSVFTRDGVQVFSSDDYQNDWKGRYKGKPLPEGSYYYVVECGNNEVVSGTISILR